MNLYLGPCISQMFWRLVYSTERAPGWPSPHYPAGTNACRMAEIEPLLPPWVDLCLEQGGAKLDTLSFDQAQRCKSASHITRMWCGAVPEGSFFSFGNGLYVSSPCFTFLQMAKLLSLPELIAYGDELCGVYAFDEREPRGMRQRNVPLISSNDLQRYLASARGCPGLRMAQRALPYVVDGSASPMETVGEMLLCLPPRLGGYGLPTAEMNLEIPLGRRAASIAGKQKCRGDLCWIDSNLVIEHQGLFDHDRPDVFEADRARIDALKLEGLNVLELTTSIVHDLASFEGIARYVADVLRKRLRPEQKGPLPQRLELRKSLFAWNARNGCVNIAR